MTSGGMSVADREIAAELAGERAYRDGKGPEACPHATNSSLERVWLRGWWHEGNRRPNAIRALAVLRAHESGAARASRAIAASRNTVRARPSR